MTVYVFINGDKLREIQMGSLSLIQMVIQMVLELTGQYIKLIFHWCNIS